MNIQNTLFLFVQILALCIFPWSYALPLAEALSQTGYVEIGDTNHEIATYTQLYAYFDEFIAFLDKNPRWAHTLCKAKERFIRSKIKASILLILDSTTNHTLFDSITFAGKTPNYSLSYLPAQNPTFVQFNFLGYPSRPINNKIQRHCCERYSIIKVGETNVKSRKIDCAVLKSMVAESPLNRYMTFRLYRATY